MFFSRSLLLLFLLAAVRPAASQDSAELRSLDSIRRLPRQRQAERPAVEVRGTMLTPLPDMRLYQDGGSLQIDTAAAAARGVDGKSWAAFRPGDRLLVRGHVRAGQLAPAIDPDTMELLEHGSLPEPRAVTAADLLAGHLDGQWVEINGVVQTAVPSPRQPGAWDYEIGTPHGEFEASAAAPGSGSLIGSHVRIRGFCEPRLHFRGHMQGLTVRIPSPEDITVMKSADTDPFQVPEISPGSLRGFDPAHSPDGGRRRLTGIVTFAETGSHLFLQTDGLGVKISLLPGQTAGVGDLVEVSGFVPVGHSSAALNHALVRRLGTAPLPDPAPLTTAVTTLSSILHPSVQPGGPPPPDVHCRLVALHGKLLRTDRLSGTKSTLWIETPGDLPLTVPVTVIGSFTPPRSGSVVEIRGICELNMMEKTGPGVMPSPASLKIHASAPEGVRVLSVPPWWTPVRLWALAGGMALLCVLVLLRARSLRRQLRTAANALADAIVHRQAAETRAEERQRLSVEIHDIMAQSLTGVALQLGAAEIARASAPAEVSRHLKLASGLLDFARDEIRRTLLDLRSGLLDSGDLTRSFRSMGEMFARTGVCEIRWEINGSPPPAHPLTVHSLLRVIQEGLTNAVKHGHATLIGIRLDYSASGISISIRDNGQGGNPAAPPGPADGHFGLENLRGRVRRLGGSFRFLSIPGKGAILEASVPSYPEPLPSAPEPAADLSRTVSASAAIAL